MIELKRLRPLFNLQGAKLNIFATQWITIAVYANTCFTEMLSHFVFTVGKVLEHQTCTSVSKQSKLPKKKKNTFYNPLHFQNVFLEKILYTIP
jgi:hypothetical protein